MIHLLNGAIFTLELCQHYFQHLTRKKDRSEFASKHWKEQSHNNILVTKAVDCMMLDDGLEKEAEKKRIQELKRAESKKAQTLAMQIASHIDDMGCEKSKTQNG